MGKYHVTPEIKEKFITLLEQAAYTNHTNIESVFRAWVSASAYAASGAIMGMAGEVEEGKERMQYCTDICSKYSDDITQTFLTLSENLRNELAREPRDVLGEIYLGIQASNSALGQNFTPLHVAELMANFSIGVIEKETIKEPFYISDPTCGSGIMAIGSYRHLIKQGLTTKQFTFVAQDVDIFCCHMAFLQMELLGISAIVYHDNTLTHPFGPNADIDKIYATQQYCINHSPHEVATPKSA